jgi:hypothetical protein
MLVGALSDLQGVWSSPEEKALLLALPLPAMQLLLSSDLVRVPSEDTVLCTALQHVQAQTQEANKAAAKAALAPLIRVPQLSSFALYWAELAARSSETLLSSYDKQLQTLLHLKMVAQVAPEEVTAGMADVPPAPHSWGLGARQIRPLSDGVRLTWWVTVEQVKQACKDSFAGQKVVFINSHGSPPMGGVAWHMSISCGQHRGGTVVGLHVGAVDGDLPPGSRYQIKCTLIWHGVQRTLSSPSLQSTRLWGHEIYLTMQPMTGTG